MDINLLKELLQKVLIFFVRSVISMDGLDIYLTKWDTMNNSQRAIVSILVMGAIAIALDAIFHFIGELVQPILGNTMRDPFNPLIYAILIILFAGITVLASKRDRGNGIKVLKVEQDLHDKEITQLKADCQWLFDENNNLRYLMEKFVPASETKPIELSASILLEQTTPKEARRGEIRKRLSEK